MTFRYFPVRDCSHGLRDRLARVGVDFSYEVHPDAPQAGFATAQACLAWMDRANLGWQWYIQPEEES
jgi:hypothetical protein